MIESKNEKIAVIGAGVSGMSAAYLLTKGGYQVTVYEKGDYLGGHTNTVEASFENGKVKVPVDTGFIIYTQARYKNLTRLFKELNVESIESSMSFSFSLNNRDIPELTKDQLGQRRSEVEWGSDSLSCIFAQWSNIFKPSYWRMILDLVRFSKEGPKVLENPEYYKHISIKEYVKTNGYSQSFIDYYLVPVMSSLWSTSFKEIDQFPILTLCRFFGNHNMFQLFGRPVWQTVKGGSINYMNKLKIFLEANGSNIKLSTPVSKIQRKNGVIEISDSKGHIETFDRIVIACHPPDIFPMLSDMTAEESNILSQFKYSYHQVYLHSDERLMPKRKQIWSSWNYILDDNSQTEQKVCVTYWMNRLQPWLDKHQTPLYVTLNPVIPIHPDKIHKIINYDHPLYTRDSVHSRERLQQIQGIKNTYYAGAYYGFGFHEDGIISGLVAAQSLDPSLSKIWPIDMTRYNDSLPPNDHLPVQNTSWSTRILQFSAALLIGSSVYYNLPIY
ncbi:hypothetical protein DLAC_07606 [Tieghemostelium lacteum]|uniref:Amine oxidase domain-containing protein n=1 Tax=Tieghemostelium lacteum TaxID=361077 RepID=A0A151ZD03_TIELA|nr:hypothetical protein DLAC_07606 [Tieghemostelium lacteum]|eukprot:KYQ91811.1 hypothetical protein DLAC_07606 [Tieghemostelium lacteum]